jgi:hypothetical protein
MTTLTLPESARLVALEKTIAAGQKTFVEVGIALAEIRDAKLYKSDFDTFEAYCRQKWQWDKSYCTRLINAAAVTKTVPIGTIQNEAQARQAAKIPAERRAVAVTKAKAKADSEGRSMRARDIIDIDSEERPRVIAEPMSSAQEAEEAFKSLEPKDGDEDPFLDAIIIAWEEAPKSSREKFRKFIN